MTKARKVKSLDQAMMLAKTGRIKAANAIYGQLLKDKPRNPAILRAVISFHNRYSLRFRRALPAVRLLLELRPQSADAHMLAAETLGNCGRLTQAEKHAQTALQLAADDPDARFVAAFIAMQRRHYDAALRHLDHALTLRPDHPPILLQKARAMIGLGQIDEARALCRALLDKNPDDVNAIGVYVNAAPIASDDPVFAYLQNDLLPRLRKVGGAHLAHLLKLIGKAQNDIGAYDAAFANYTRAKALLPMRYDAKRYAAFVRTLCTQIARADYFGRGNQSDTPVLIVGMPRSGVTLLEQVLTGHAQIASAGDSTSLHAIVQDTKVRTHQGADMVQAIKQIPDAAAQNSAARYLAETAQPDARRIIDKTLHNFELLGFFATMLPRARIIHIRRDPMDTCVSCYMQNLPPRHTYTQSLDALGHTYVHYDKLMRHWATVLPNPILELTYEDTITDREGVAKRAVEFLGLDWDPSCLGQDSPNRTNSPLTWQARAPIYTASLHRWRRYEPHLDPLKKRLACLYPDGFDAFATPVGVAK
ncbi:MAG: sulfotransferase [Pseudomonadota bacterium]